MERRTGMGECVCESLYITLKKGVYKANKGTTFFFRTLNNQVNFG